MIINIKRLFDAQGEVLPLEFDLDLSRLERFGQRPFQKPVHVKGTVENRAGIVTLSYTADYEIHAVCDRCLAPIARPCSNHFEHVIVDRLFDEDTADLLLSADGLVDLQELASSDIVLLMPIKLLCQEDCKGLCPKCGTNLNESSCGCDTRRLDPRLETLRKLLEETNNQ